MPATPAKVDCFNHFGVVVLTAVLFETFRLNKGVGGETRPVTQNLETQIGLETRSCCMPGLFPTTGAWPGLVGRS